MGRPENAISWDGPVAELARTLRALRARAGQPPYRAMAASIQRGASVLADAAAGRHCPTWAVTRDFARALGEDPAQLRPLWERAHKSSRKRRSPSTAGAAPAPAPPPASTGTRAARPAPPAEPDPWQASTPGEYVLQLRALRAWSGQSSFYEVAHAYGANASGPAYEGGRLSQSTMYDALNPNRSRMPPLSIVRAIVTACRADVDQWVQAWQRLRMQEFHNTPLPARRVDPLRELRWEQANRAAPTLVITAPPSDDAPHRPPQAAGPPDTTDAPGQQPPSGTVRLADAS